MHRLLEFVKKRYQGNRGEIGYNKQFTEIRPAMPIAVIGDVHGCLSKLELLLTQISDCAPDARIVFVGDIIDRGPDSHGVLSLVHSLTRSSAVMLCGNHERMLLDVFDALSDDDPSANFTNKARRWLHAGGDAVLKNYHAALDIDDIHTYRDAIITLRTAIGSDIEKWLRTLPPIWASGNVAVTHAGANPREPIDTQNPDHCIWGHAAFGKYARRDGFWIVHGHRIVAAPIARAGIISVDTGAYCGGPLTAALIRCGDVRFISAREPV